MLQTELCLHQALAAVEASGIRVSVVRKGVNLGGAAQASRGPCKKRIGGAGEKERKSSTCFRTDGINKLTIILAKKIKAKITGGSIKDNLTSLNFLI